MIIVSALLGLLRIDTIQVGSFYDDSHYIVLAESLANGSGYRLINYPVSPPENAFPPGWSLILSPFVAFFPENYALLKVVSFAFWLLSILLILRLFRQRINHGWLTFLIVYVVIHPAMVGISGTVMSESAYLFFSLSSLVVIARWQRERPVTLSDPRKLMAAVILLAAREKTPGTTDGDVTPQETGRVRRS